MLLRVLPFTQHRLRANRAMHLSKGEEQPRWYSLPAFRWTTASG
jgi:hypothetical protein